MQHFRTRLRDDALQIWQAGVRAVDSARLVRQSCRVDEDFLHVGDVSLPLPSIRRIVVVGAGKAGAGMAAAVEAALGPRIMAEKQLTGWVNVPGDCVRRLERIHLHAARPAGVNEPTIEGVAGTAQILRLVESLSDDDLCLCLISGGGSALMPAPIEGITLADKLAVTRHLSAAGANIEQLNMVRKQLSRIKGGGLLRACRAGRLIALIISDVLGDPLDVIASGPTVPDSSTPAAALEVLELFAARQAGISAAVFAYLETAAHTAEGHENGTVPFLPRVENFVIGNNATAVAAAAEEAKRLGYSVTATSAPRCEGLAEDVGCELAAEVLTMRAGHGPTCLISGGEPVVRLVDAARRGLGGRNQQLVLAALVRLLGGMKTGTGTAIGDGSASTTIMPIAEPVPVFSNSAAGLALLSGGTDGEDGPTPAAGALLDAEVIAACRQKGLDPCDYLARNDAYHFFEPLGGLLCTGPTHTNVGDLRVVVVER
jgi:glycerate 2-kinase